MLKILKVFSTKIRSLWSLEKIIWE